MQPARPLLAALALLALAPAALAQDAPAVEELRGRLARHHHLSKLTFELAPGPAPFAFAVQRTLTADAPDAARVVAELAPWLSALEASLREEYALPGGWQRRADASSLGVVVMASRGAFADYLRATWKIDAADGDLASFLEHQNRLLVTHRDHVGMNVRAADLRFTCLREAATWLLSSYSSGAPLPRWLENGFVSYLAASDDDHPASLRRHPLQPATARIAVHALRDDELRALYWLPLEELVTLSDARALAARLERVAAERKVASPSLGLAIKTAVAQGAALVHHLSQADEGARRAAFDVALKRALAGEGAEATAELFAGVDLRALEVDVARHLCELHARMAPGEAVPAEQLARIFAPPPADPAQALGSFDAQGLPALLADDEARLALALARVRRGEAALAAELLEELARDAAEPLRARAERELERARAWIRLRDDFLRHLAETGAKLSIEHGGGKLVAEVERFDAGRVRFGRNRADVHEVQASALDPLELAKEMGSSKLGFEGGWARAYLYWLGGLGSWKRLLGDADAERALREDVELDGEAWLALSQAAGRLDALAREGAAHDLDEAEALLAELRELWRSSSGVRFVEVLRPQLAALARTALELRLREEDPGELLAGRVEELPGGVLRLTYDFAREDQAADFPAVRASRYPARYAAMEHGVEGATSWTAGALRLQGDSARRHALAFQAPMRLAFTWSYLRGGDNQNPMTFVAGLCASGSSFVGSLDGCHAEVLGPDGEHHREPGGPSRPTYDGVEYRLELVHDGERVTLSVDGEELGSVPCEGLLAGDVFLWSSCEHPLVIDELVLEGRPTDASLAGLGAGWIEERLRELGLAGG